MGRITIGLLRKRAEHNEGCLTNLVEIALHQQEIEKLEVIGETCRQLEILYLCNNYIPRIENIHMLKRLKYLNLAVNNIKVIEGLDGCESLERLDLTLNFIGDLTSIANLRGNIFLETLYLTGNPCTQIEGYRKFVIQTLPQLMHLDGEEVHRSEAIIARQEHDDVAEVVDLEKEKVRTQQRLHEEMRAKGIDPFPPKYNEKGERVYGHSAEERLQMLREQEEQEAAKKNPPKDPNSISAIAEEINKKPKRLTIEEELEKYGRIIMRNEGKLPFNLEEKEEECVLTVEPGKFISTSLINVQADTKYIRVTVKEKLLQLPTPEEIHVSAITVQRATTNGALKITMPYAPHVVQQKREAKKRRQQLYSFDVPDDDDTAAIGAKSKPAASSASQSKPTETVSKSTSGPELKTRRETDIGLKEASSSKATPTTPAETPNPQRKEKGPSMVEELDD
jgi:protein TilB